MSIFDSIIDNVFRDTVSEPEIGSIVYCDLITGYAEHSGVYIGNNKIVHLDGNGIIEAVSPDTFINRLDGFNTAISIYVSCVGTMATGSKRVAKNAKSMVGMSREYNFILNNCHQFTAGCVTGDFENSCNFLWILKDKVAETIGSNTWRVWSR